MPTQHRVVPDRVAHRRRRAPAAGERVRDAAASRAALLAAALDEFAAKGFAGARVQDIADRAGLNKQLISYYFDGKEGLYEGLAGLWRQREAVFADPGVAFDELAARYLREALSDPRLIRLLIWRGLSGDTAEPGESDLTHGLRRRQQDGQIAADLDPRAVLVALLGMVTVPIAMPQRVRQITGLDPTSTQFEELFTDQLRRIVGYLRGPTHPCACREQANGGRPAPSGPGPGPGPGHGERGVGR